jgi:phosphate transport system substrate-binding protein
MFRPRTRPRKRKAFYLIGAMTVPCLLSVLPGAITVAKAAPEARTSSSPCGGPVAEITGSGSTWAQNAVDEWIANEYQNGINVVFNGDGSAAGRTNFALSTVDFAVSDIGYQGYDPVTNTDDVSHRPYAYLPVTAGGTSFPYNLVVNGTRITNLRLSGKTLAEIFTNHITNWDDPAITADNNGRKLPNLPIITVVPSEGSGTSAQFTDYLNTLYPQYWVPFNGGHKGLTEYWPQQGSNQVAQTGSAQVMNYITSAAANGSIGFDEYSYALQAGYPVAAVENAAHYFVLPSEYNDAVALTKAQINYDTSSPDYLLETLTNVYKNPDPRTYPLSSYSYTIMPTSKTDELMAKSGSPGFPAKAQALACFLDYSICQGQDHIGPIGYSALPVNLVEAGFKQIEKIKTAASQVNISALNIKNCDNPTFIAGQPNENHLAKIAPYPPACDKAGNGPCSGILDANSNGGKGSGSKEGSGKGSGSGKSGSGSSGNSGSGGHSGNGNSGSGSSSNNGSGSSTSSGTTTTSSGSTGTTGNVRNVASTLPPGQANGLNDVSLAVLAVLLLLAILIVPPLVYRRLSRGRQY